ncbi:MAG: flagellar hook-basal body complex protein FliE [Variibacter sp.]|nr:flagellar hook-basal body complex protein FliE [Variibacter sp.]
MPSPLAAANAYATLARMGGQGAGPSRLPTGADKTDGSFASMLKEAIGGVLEAGRKADLQAQALAAGKADIVDVVTAVAETEVAVETLVSVRDRVIQSYEEIMRMPI